MKSLKSPLLYIKGIIVLSVLFSIRLDTLSQEEEYEWPSANSFAIIPDSLQAEDAIIIDQYTKIEIPEYTLSISIDDIYNYDYIYDKFMSDYYHTIESYKRIKILTQKGLDDYAFIYLPSIDMNSIELIDARAIKPNGEVKDVNREDIKKTVFAEIEELDWKFGDLRFAIPGVEKGDEIELIYKIRDYGIRYIDDVFLQTYLPVLSSKYYVDIPAYAHVAYKLYNSFPQPEVLNDSSRINLEFQIENQQSLLGQVNGSAYLDLPYFSICIYPTIRKYVKEDLSPDWHKIYNSYTEVLKEDQSYSNRRNYLWGYLKNITKDMDEHPNTEWFKFVYEEIKNNVQVRDLKEVEEGYSTSYYFHEGFIDRHTLSVLYRQIFEYFEMDYYMGVAREKKKGPIDKFYLRPNELSHVFFMYRDDEDHYHYVYPHTYDRKYEIDEMPGSLSGTTAIILKEENDSILIKESLIPEGSSEYNSRKKNILINVSIDERTGHYHTRKSYSGALSTRYRFDNDSVFASKSYLKDYNEKYFEDDSLQTFDTMYVEQRITERPFTYRYSIKFSELDFINDLGEGIFSLSTDELIGHITFKTPEVDRTLNYNNNYCYSDLNKIFIVSDKPIELLNEDDFKFNVDNPFGKYEFFIKPVNQNTIMVESQYILKESYVPKEEYEKLIDVNNELEKAENATILFKVLQ